MDIHPIEDDQRFLLVMQVGLSAINDGVLLKCHVQAIIKRYFKDKLYFLDLLELWNEVITERT